MKVLIDNLPLEQNFSQSKSFPDFCKRVMEILLVRNLSIGSCEFDGKPVSNLEEGQDLFSRCEVCKIASIPLTIALEAALCHKCQEALRLESKCEGLVTEALLGEPDEMVIHWHLICEEIKSQVGFLPRLAGLLTDSQVNLLVDHHLAEFGRILEELHVVFLKGDTLKISDAIELKLLPWLRQLRTFMESCLQLVRNLHP